MSRIGRLPITVPSGVTVAVEPGNLVKIKGPKGELEQRISDDLTIKQENGTIEIERPNNLYRTRSQHGLARTLVANMITGVTDGHKKLLQVQGVGYRVQMEGKNLILNMGYSHPVKVEALPGITFEVTADEKTRAQSITVNGIDKALVGQVAADIRKVRKPDPYKGKGIRYAGEIVRLKAGKRAAKKK
ncbi:MAG TPA: 50S ribosomal protein L6 [Fimbriimonadaceae bacterium]|nr:50S ribosomal protein L6 [Fimbriimonadaceae bacterium]HRJ96572.1 50S ribosomal protein L6 [Fimbriimonadaceae bacterium]